MTTPLRVLLATDGLDQGGAERQLSILARSLPGAWQPQVWSLAPGRFATELTDAGIAVKVCRRRFPWDPLPLFDLWRTTVEFSPLVIHSWGWMSGLAASLVSVLAGIPHVAGSIRSGSLPPRRSVASSLTVKLGKRIVANSQAGIEAFGIGRKGRVVYNGFDPERVVPPAAGSGLPAMPRRVVMVGRLVKAEKDHRTFLEAARRLAAEDPGQWAFVAIGDGPDAATLRTDASDLLASGSFALLESVGDVLPLLRDSFAGVLLSPLGEGCSNAIMEYMASSLPVICSDKGGNRELVRDQETGFLIQDGSPDELCQRLRQLRDDPALARRLGEAGRERVLGEFSVERMVDRTISIYEECLPRRARGLPAQRVPDGPRKTETPLLMLVDYRGQFQSSTRYKDAGMDVNFLAKCFNRRGREVEIREFGDLDLRGESFAGRDVLYQSSEDRDLRYKSFIEDVLLALQHQGAHLVPSFACFRAHHNKIFMELLRDLTPGSETWGIRSRGFGTLEEFRQHAPQLSYPVVLKGTDTVMGAKVSLARDERQALTQARGIMRSLHPVDAVKDLVKSRIRRPYDRKSNRRRGIVSQTFVGNVGGDYKVLVFWDRHFALARRNRPNDFRASGSGLFTWTCTPPEGLLDFSRDVFDAFDVPFISLDIGYDGRRFYLFEFQFVCFGAYTLEFAPFHFERQDRRWLCRHGRCWLEEEYARSISYYLEGKNRG